MKIFVTMHGLIAMLLFSIADLCRAQEPSEKHIEGEAMKKSEDTCGQDHGASCGLPQDDAELRKLLSPEQYRITKQNATEQPFSNAYWNNKRPGIYVDVISGEALFSSLDKFESGTGWPSFTKPIKDEVLSEKSDSSHGMTRREVRSKKADSHLGHVFNDGPKPTGLRYCINSASLQFVSYEHLEERGYGQYKKLFEGKISNEGE